MSTDVPSTAIGTFATGEDPASRSSCNYLSFSRVRQSVLELEPELKPILHIVVVRRWLRSKFQDLCNSCLRRFNSSLRVADPLQCTMFKCAATRR